MKTVQLNDAEQRLVKFVAQKRIEYDRQMHAGATLYGDRQTIDNEINSFGAEVAYCKLWNTYPDLDWTHYAPQDAIVRGKRVDVKHTVRPDGRLLVKAKERGATPDYYALMVGTFPVYRFAGHIKADEIIQPEYLDRTLPHPAYAVRQDKLK